MNGNISEEGIKLDLDWMHRVGLGGVTIFEGAINTPQVVPRRLIYMTPEWKQAFTYAVTTARSLGMEVAIASSPGWSETGGPVGSRIARHEEDGVDRDAESKAASHLPALLTHPPEVDGTFQNFQVPGGAAPMATVITAPPSFMLTPR
jgi:hypothetical protein